MQQTWLSSDYTLERWRRRSQREGVWGEVVHLLARSRIQSGPPDWWQPGWWGSWLEFRPPHLPLPYAAQVFQIRLLFASFPWWVSLSGRFSFAEKGQIADRFVLIREIFNPAAHATPVSIFNNRTFNKSKSGTKGVLSGLIVEPKWGHLYPRLLPKQGCADTHTHRRCHWIIKTLTPVNSHARGRD